MAVSGNKGSSLLKIGGFEAGFVILVLVILFGILNYFNIVSLSSLYPNQLGFLPHKTFPILTYPSPTPTTLTTIPCPVDPEFCSSGRLIATTSGKIKWYGLIYNLPLDSSIKAVFQGTVDEGKITEGLVGFHPFLRLLKDNRSTIKAEYEFFGTSVDPWKDNDRQHGVKFFNPGDVIGFIGKSEGGKTNFLNTPPLNGANFILSIKQNDKYFKMEVQNNVIKLTQP